MARKTASIIAMIERTNTALARPTPKGWSEEKGQAFREGIATALEMTLLENGVYNGFSYLDSAKVARNPDGTAARPWRCEDESRRYYSVHPKLLK